MSDFLDRMSTKRLMAYSAAAGLGAFSFGQSADAAIVASNVIAGVTLNTPNAVLGVDIDGVGGNDISILNGTRGVTFNTSPGGTVFSNHTPAQTPALTANYYVFGYQTGNTIDGSPYPAAGGVNLIANLTYNYHFVADGDWIGFQFDIAGATHFAAAQVIQISGNSEIGANGTGAGLSTINSTFGVILYESSPNTPFVIPEPASLGLLAAGAGALGLRRRRKA